MSHILIISATYDLNLDLAKDLQVLLSDLGQEAEILELEKLKLPLFGSENRPAADTAEKLTDQMISASAFIFCAPEYNGSIPPILTSIFAWLSVCACLTIVLTISGATVLFSSVTISPSLYFKDDKLLCVTILPTDLLITDNEDFIINPLS